MEPDQGSGTGIVLVGRDGAVLGRAQQDVHGERGGGRGGVHAGVGGGRERGGGGAEGRHVGAGRCARLERERERECGCRCQCDGGAGAAAERADESDGLWPCGAAAGAAGHDGGGVREGAGVARAGRSAYAACAYECVL